MTKIKAGQIWVTKQNHKALHRNSAEMALQKKIVWAIDWVDDLILCVDDTDEPLTIATGSPAFFVSVSHPDFDEELSQCVVSSDILEYCDYVGEL